MSPSGPEPRVMVSVISHSNPDSLATCLDAVATATGRCPFPVEVTVLENASRDGSAQMVRARHPGVRVIEQCLRRGFGANHNSVIRSTVGQYVLVLNDDARIAPDALASLVRFLDEHPQVGVAGPRVRDERGVPVDSAVALPSLARTAKLAVSGGLWASVQSRGRRPRPVGYVSGCALLMRRRALDVVGLFDERFYMYREEVDLCQRMHEEGYQVWFVPAAEVTHTGGASTAGLAPARIAEAWRSNALYWRKHRGPTAAWVEPRMRGCLYVARWGVLVALRLLGRGEVAVGRQTIDELALNARAAWMGPRGPGLRETAEQWNAAGAPRGAGDDSSLIASAPVTPRPPSRGESPSGSRR